MKKGELLTKMILLKVYFVMDILFTMKTQKNAVNFIFKT